MTLINAIDPERTNLSEPDSGTAACIPVVPVEATDRTLAEAVAARLGVPVAASHVEVELSLEVHSGCLALRAGNRVLQVDFVSGNTARRGRRPGGERLVKALGRKGPCGQQVVDATAGLGRDAFLLASAGCEVTLLERNPVLHLLLEDALVRAREVPDVADVVARMHLLATDAVTWMRARPGSFDIAYLDPMFPPRGKSAAVRKEAQILQMLAGEGDDELALGESARVAARDRVVVKRPLHAPHLFSREPDYVLAGRSTRFDVYLNSGW